MSSLDVVATQKDEIIALRSIFGKEFKLHRPKNMKKKYEPPCLSVTIFGSFSKIGINGSLQICFDCYANYPITAPQVSLQDTNCISSELQEILLNLLKDKSTELLGTPMIHNLVEFARDFLQQINTDETIDLSSIKEPPLIECENKVKDLKLQMLRERKDSAKKEICSDKFVEKCMNLSHNDSVILKFEHCGDKVPIEVYRGVCEGHHRVQMIKDGAKIVTNCFEGFNLAKGCGVNIYQVSLQDLSKKAIAHLRSNWLKRLEEDFYCLYKLNHCNVLPYIAFRYHINEKYINKERVFELLIQYVSPNPGGMMLSTQCNIGSKELPHKTLHLPMERIQMYVKQVLEGVRYLHEKNITGIRIKIDSIIIDKDFNLKISYYHLGKRFDELKIQKHKEDDLATIKKGSKKNDILKLGKFAKKLFFFGIAENEINEEDIPGGLMAFIDSTRSNINDLHKHPFLSSKVPSDEHCINMDNNFETQDDLSSWELFEKSSRIPTEFELISKLGEGAFGDVVKVKNIYDNQYYAIKRVRLNALRKKSSKRTMREVQLLSSLNHENIVRYYASWSEEIDVSSRYNLGSSQHIHDSMSLHNNISLGRSIRKIYPMNSSLFDIQEMSNKVNSDFLNHTSSNAKSSHFYDTYSDSDSDSDSDDDSNDSSNEISEILNKKSVVNTILPEKKVQQMACKIEKFLMIQMELCEGYCNTLDKYIKEENLYLNDKLIWKFIREMVSGLEHIHSKNMIHRDLKPSNIFIDNHKRVKIGDLGLATSFNTKTTDISSVVVDESEQISSDKGVVGTLLYICPEMINHKPYSNKADMYSLGIIVFEMCYPSFVTYSEKCQILGFIRQPDILFPKDTEYKLKDNFKQLISILLDHDDTKRPSASELLRFNIIPPPESREMQLRDGLKEIMKNRSSNIYKLLLSGMFNQPCSKMGEYELPVLYQSPFKYFLSNTKLIQIKRNALQIDNGDYTFFTIKRLVSRYLESVFVCHGAVEFNAPLLTLKIMPNDSQAFTVLDCEGVAINFPLNLRNNFANFLLNNEIFSTRRYAIGNVYQQQEYRRDHPKELLEAAFDLVSDYRSDNHAVENLLIINEIFSKLFNEEHVNLCIEVNQTSIFHSIMEFYKIPENVQKQIITSAYDKFDADMVYLNSEEFKQHTSLSDSQLINLKAILTFYGKIEELDKFLKVFLIKSRENAHCKVISEAFNELLSIVQTLERFNQTLCFTVNVRLIYIPKLSLYKGFVFQLLLSIQDKFADIFKSIGQNNVQMIVKYLKNVKKICIGGDYSSFLTKDRRQLITENGDCSKNISAVGLSIDLSTVIQCVYSIEQLLFTISEDYFTNTIIHVVVQYDRYFDKGCREILSALWKNGIPSILYDKDQKSEDYVLKNKIDYLIKFMKLDDRRYAADYNIVLRKNYCKGVGLEQMYIDDFTSVEKCVDTLLTDYRKRESFVSKYDKDGLHTLQKQLSEPSSEINSEIDTKKTFSLKTELTTGKYVYVFINVKDCRENKIELKYLVETNRQIQSLRQKNSDLDISNIQLMVNLNEHLINISKWFQMKLPNQMYIILVELSYAKCLDVTSEVTLKTLKDPTKLSKIISKIESSVNYSANLEKHWKDVLSRLWKEIQEVIKDKIYKILVYSYVDDSLAFLDVK